MERHEKNEGAMHPSPPAVKRFSLTKYYMDCVTSEGEVVLCYASELTAGSVRLRQSSVLVHSEEGGSLSRQTFFRGALPVFRNGNWLWRCPALGVRGSWSGEAFPAPPVNLYEPEEGRDVTWQCLLPRAEVRLSMGGRNETGVGYVECLTMSLEPWKLPVDSLHWGRFHGEEGEALTWIIWEGAHPLGLLLEGSGCSSSVPPAHASPDGSRISFGEGLHRKVLECSCSKVLRTGDISRTALRYLPSSVRRLLPQSILHLQETKWAGPACLFCGNGVRPGFSIHEVVHFHPPCL